MPSSLPLQLFLLLAAFAPALPCIAEQAETLRTQMENLASANGIEVEGLDHLGDEPSKRVTGTMEQQIKALLANYNFVMVGAKDKIERLSITSLKQISPRPSITGAVKTRRLGSHHQVNALLDGPNGAEIRIDLLIDTGATTLVLPDSMIARLGFRPEQLRPGTSQTAAGSIPVRVGMLKSVKVGDALADNVAVSFIADRQLSGAKLLGMSFLNRFRFSLDDENNELLLLSK